MTLSNARSTASGLSSAPTSRAMSMNRLNCSGSSGALEFSVSHLAFRALFTGPVLLPPLASLIPQQNTFAGHSHTTLATKGTGVGWLFGKCFFQSSDPRLKGSDALADQNNLFCPSPYLRPERYFGAYRHALLLRIRSRGCGVMPIPAEHRANYC